MASAQTMTLDVYRFTWHFTPRALDAFEEHGISTPEVLKSFALKVLSMGVLHEGETQLNFFGIGLRIFQAGKEYTVAVLAE